MQITSVLTTAMLLAAGSLCFAAPATFAVDPVHSVVLFKIKHKNVAHSYGRFNETTGTFILDDESPEKNTVQLEIKVDSIDTHNGKRDQHLKGPDFFNSAQYPAITFKSTAVKKEAENKFDVTGDLTLHGVTKPVNFKLDKIGAAEEKGTTLAGGEAKFTIKRSDYGMNYMMGGLGDDVEVIVALEGKKQP